MFTNWRGGNKLKLEEKIENSLIDPPTINYRGESSQLMVGVG